MSPSPHHLDQCKAPVHSGTDAVTADEPNALPSACEGVDTTAARQSAIIAMAWADEVPFEAIKQQYGLTETQIIALMRRSLKRASFRLWRERVQGRLAKHQKRQQAQHAKRSQRHDEPLGHTVD